MTPALTLFFAMALCVVNAILWTLYTHQPIASAGWALAAVGCVKLEKWARR